MSLSTTLRPRPHAALQMPLVLPVPALPAIPRQASPAEMIEGVIAGLALLSLQRPRDWHDQVRHFVAILGVACDRLPEPPPRPLTPRQRLRRAVRRALARAVPVA